MKYKATLLFDHVTRIIKGEIMSNLDRQEGGEHYKTMGIYQPWQVAHAQMTSEELKGAMKLNVNKYLAREASKNGREDIRKAYHTLGIYLELTEP